MSGGNSLISDFLAASEKTSVFSANGMIPDRWQEQLITSNANTLVCCSRQAGKSTGAAGLATHTFYYNPGTLSLIVSPTEKQSAELLRRGKAMLRAMPGSGGMMNNATTYIESPTGSRVMALPGTDASTRGFSPNLLILDEAAYLADDTIRAMMPSTVVTRSRIVMLSTPAGKVGIFYELWANTEEQIRKGDDPSWDLIRVTCETPEVMARQGQSFIEMERQTRSQYEFAQEYLAEFTASDSSVYNPYSIDAAFVDTTPSVIIEGGIE